MPATCDDGLAGSVTSNCAAGTDCDDCGHRHLCSSCPAECAAMISDSTPTYCLEEMWAAKACYPECNTYQCGHRHCTTAQAIAKCAIEQGALSATMLTTPNEFDLATNVTSTASDTSTLVPMDVQLGISGISLSIDAVANQMQMKLSYTLSLKWRDSRLDTAPCATMMQTAMTYKAGASTADVDRAGTMSALLWFPHISFLNSAGSQGTIQTESSTFALEAESPWSAGSPSDGSASCAECATYTTTGSVSMYLAPTWKYAQFPFDTHEIVYEVRVSDAELFNCKEMFTGMALSTEELRTSTLLPATQEWGFLEDGQRSMRLEFGRGARGVGEDRSVCVVRIEVRRNSVVFAIKQLAVTVIVVVCGLCALFLHAADHTGDRTALVLLAALICATSFQTDLGLGSIHYILWFDVWNVCNIALLLVCLVLCLYEHQLFMTDREKEATILNGITRWLLPFAYYPTVVIALFWHGWYPTSAAPWIVLVIGFAGISVFFRLKLRHAHATSDKRQREVIAALSEAQLASDDFVRLLNDAFAAFDADRSGDIDLDELRTVLKAIFPAASHQEFAGLMLQVREFCAGSNALDCNAFVDAVMHLSKVYAPRLEKLAHRDDDTDLTPELGMGLPVSPPKGQDTPAPMGSHACEPVDATAHRLDSLRIGKERIEAPADPTQGVVDSWEKSSWRTSGDELDLCGRRVRVMWEKGCPRVQANGGRHTSRKDQWWAGFVAAHSPEAGRHRIEYDDGDVELLKFNISDPASAQYWLTEVGPNDVGRRLSVLWKANMPRTTVDGRTQRVKRDLWYRGTLVALEGKRFAPDTPGNYFVSDAARVQYDDGDVELLDMGAHEFKWE